MIGLGVGIDYALFIVTRFREGFEHGLERRGVRRRVDRHQRSGGAVRRHDGHHLAVGMFLMGLTFVNGLAIGAIARRAA